MAVVHVALYVTVLTRPPRLESLLIRMPLSLPAVLPELSLPFRVLLWKSTLETPALVSLPIEMPCVPQKKLFLTVMFCEAWLPPLMATPSSPASMKELAIVMSVPLGSSPSVLRAVAGVRMRTPQAVKPVPPFMTMWKFGPLVRLRSKMVVLLTPLDWMRCGLFWLPPLAACEARAHQVVEVPRMSRSPRPSIRPWWPPLVVPITPEFDPVIVIRGWQPPFLEA